MKNRVVRGAAMTALAIPLVAGTVWWSLRQLHRRMFSH